MNYLLQSRRGRQISLLLTLLLAAAGCKETPKNVLGVNVPIPTPDFSLNCPGQTSHFANVDTFLVIGHRGSPTNEVENTIPSFQRAMNEGANSLEIDLSMTADGHVVLWHDWNPDDAVAVAREQGGEAGMFCRPRFPKIGSAERRPVDELSLELFRTHFWYASKNIIDKERLDAEIPTFEQFVEWAAQQEGLYYVMLDMKIPGNKAHLTETMIAKMEETLAKHNPKFKWVYMTPQSSVWEVIANMIEGTGLAFDVDLGGGLVADQPCDISSSRYARSRGAGFATTMHPFVWTESPWTTLKRLLLCDLETRDNPQENGVPAVEKVVAATINNTDKMECLVNMGVDGLMTDKPGELAGIAKGLGKFVR